MWRKLFADYTASSYMVVFAGKEAFREYPRCTNIAETVAHVEGWISMLNEYGGELKSVPMMFRSTFLNIIPPESRTAMLKDKDMSLDSGHMKMVEWICNRCAHMKQETLADAVKKNLSSQVRRKISSVQEVQHGSRPNIQLLLCPNSLTASLRCSNLFGHLSTLSSLVPLRRRPNQVLGPRGPVAETQGEGTTRLRGRGQPQAIGPG